MWVAGSSLAFLKRLERKVDTQRKEEMMMVKKVEGEGRVDFFYLFSFFPLI